MGKAGRWLRSILAGKKRDGGVRGRERKALPQPQGDATASPPSATGTPREKKRWSFRRPSSVAQGKPVAAAAASPSPLSQEQKPSQSVSGREIDVQSERAMEVAVAAADAAVMAATQAAAAVARLAETEEESDVLARWLVEEAAAARIQATFRGYLARKALCALRGLVKLQALIRGQLVRRQATATLRRMQALVSAQSRLRAQHARLLDHQDHPAAAQCRSPQHPRRRSSYEMNRSSEEHIKVVEMDVGEPARRGRNSCSVVAGESRDRRLAAEYYYQYQYGQCSPAPSSAALPDLSPRTYSGHLDDLLAFDSAAATARSGSPYDATDMGYVPSYMANTESSRAKARSQSAPRQRTDALERQPSRRRGGGAPSKKTMQRSSSHIGVPATACRYQFQYPPWAGVRLDRSSASLVGSECGSTSSVLTAATAAYCRSLVGFEVQREATTEHRLQEARHVSNCIRQH